MRLKKNFYKSLDLYIGIWALIASFAVFNETIFSVSWWLDIIGVIIGISLIVSGLFLGDKA